MKITSIFEKEEITVSFEVFPPKTTTNYEVEAPEDIPLKLQRKSRRNRR